MLLRRRNISFGRVPEVLQTAESTLMSQLCQKVIFLFFIFEVDKKKKSSAILFENTEAQQ